MRSVGPSEMLFGKPESGKVFLAALRERAFPNMTREQFAEHVTEAHSKGLLELSRHDMPDMSGAREQALSKLSEVRRGNATFHLARIPEGLRRR